MQRALAWWTDYLGWTPRTPDVIDSGGACGPSVACIGRDGVFLPGNIDGACDDCVIYLNPAFASYDRASVLAHEIGHLIGYSHEDGPPIMDVGQWHGPATIWCSVVDRDSAC